MSAPDFGSSESSQTCHKGQEEAPEVRKQLHNLVSDNLAYRGVNTDDRWKIKDMGEVSKVSTSYLRETALLLLNIFVWC